jgi:hypothetical protein
MPPSVYVVAIVRWAVCWVTAGAGLNFRKLTRFSDIGRRLDVQVGARSTPQCGRRDAFMTVTGAGHAPGSAGNSARRPPREEFYCSYGESTAAKAGYDPENTDII